MENPVKTTFDSNNQQIFEKVYAKAKEKGYAEAAAESYADAYVEGIEEGIDMLQQLYEVMLEVGKSKASIVKEVSDKMRRKELFKQYGITPA